MRVFAFLGLASLSLCACSGDDGSNNNWWGPGDPHDRDASHADGSDPLDSGPLDGDNPPDAKNDADPPDGTPEADADDPVTTVAVSHTREMRGTWIATVSNINWPSNHVAATQKNELIAILDAVKKAGLNTVFFQVRPEADALYASNIEPWSRYLTGTQGKDPGYDPLVFAIEESHRRGLELHAWLNPYRAKAGNVGTCASNHVSNTIPQAVVSYGNYLWLDPGHPDAFAHTLSVIEDLLARYDLDGIHFDDYFYPYPESGVAFPDNATYAAHGNGMSKADWRRDNVNRMVAAVGERTRSLRPDVRWGISPFGIYRPGMPPGVTGLDQYADIYADPLQWMQAKSLEYIAPQLYWPTTSKGQPYGALLTWWDAQAAGSGRTLFIGNASYSKFGLDEYRAEMNAVRNPAATATHGEIWYNVGQIVSNTDGLATMVATEFYHRPAATPKLQDASNTPPPYPAMTVDTGDVVVLSSSDDIRYWAVYQQKSGPWELVRLIPSSVSQFHLSDGTWAVSAIDRSGRESEGVVVEGSGAPGDDPSDPPGPTYSSCTHSFGGSYVHGGCSPSYQCCDGSWKTRGSCGACVCEESTGYTGCGM